MLHSSTKGAWYTFMQPAIFWDELYAPFQQVSSDTVLTCSPMCVTLHTAAADTIRQVTERRNDFLKLTHIYQIIDIFGKSTVSVEGHLWKKHRKVISGIFNKKANDVVWSESVYQIQQMLSEEVPEFQSSSASIEDIEGLFSRAALAIISQAGYGVRIGLGGSSKDPGEQNDWVEGKTNGHKLSYADAILSISGDLAGLQGQYMREMIAAKRDQIDNTLDSKPKQRNADLLSNLVESARGVQDFVEDQSTGSGKIGLDGFSDDEIMGNAFLVIMAGHETIAGSLYIALLLLAMNGDSQRRLQNEVDNLFGGRNPSDWSYEHDFSPAFNGMLGAVVSETLRWMPPVSAILKGHLKHSH